MPSQSLLTLDNVEVRRAGRVVVQVPHLQVGAGEWLHVTGHNGAGKTTLLSAVGGALPYTGQIEIAGHAPHTRPARAACFGVATRAVLLGDLTVQENMQFMAGVWHTSPEPMLHLARRLGLEPWLGEWPEQLSSGTAHKAALCIGLGLGCPLLLLDEPLNTLDVTSSRVVLEALQRHVQSGGALVMTQHGGAFMGLGLATHTFELHAPAVHTPTAEVSA